MTETLKTQYKYAYQMSSEWKTIVDSVFSGSEQCRDQWSQSRKSWVLEFEKNNESTFEL